jgi:hypothetical protein
MLTHFWHSPPCFFSSEYSHVFETCLLIFARLTQVMKTVVNLPFANAIIFRKRASPAEALLQCGMQQKISLSLEQRLRVSQLKTIFFRVRDRIPRAHKNLAEAHEEEKNRLKELV